MPLTSIYWLEQQRVLRRGQVIDDAVDDPADREWAVVIRATRAARSRVVVP